METAPPLQMKKTLPRVQQRPSVPQNPLILLLLLPPHLPHLPHPLPISRPFKASTLEEMKSTKLWTRSLNNVFLFFRFLTLLVPHKLSISLLLLSIPVVATTTKIGSKLKYLNMNRSLMSQSSSDLNTSMSEAWNSEHLKEKLRVFLSPSSFIIYI